MTVQISKHTLVAHIGRGVDAEFPARQQHQQHGGDSKKYEAGAVGQDADQAAEERCGEKQGETQGFRPPEAEEFLEADAGEGCEPGPIARSHRGVSLTVARLLPGPAMAIRAIQPRQPSSQNSCSS